MDKFASECRFLCMPSSVNAYAYVPGSDADAERWAPTLQSAQPLAAMSTASAFDSISHTPSEASSRNLSVDFLGMYLTSGVHVTPTCSTHRQRQVRAT
jgi:hypothetical protein